MFLQYFCALILPERSLNISINKRVVFCILFYRKRGAKCDRILRRNEEKQKLMDAGKRFLEVLQEMDVNRDSEIDMDEFRNAFEKVKQTK